jgi:hypothetical protein
MNQGFIVRYLVKRETAPLEAGDELVKLRGEIWKAKNGFEKPREELLRGYFNLLIRGELEEVERGEVRLNYDY